MSCTVIAGMELKFPDDEAKKNLVWKPIVIPQNDYDIFPAFDQSSRNQRAALKDLGMFYFRNKRVDLLYHIPFMAKMQIILEAMRLQPKIDKQFEKFIKQIESEQKQ